MTRDDLAFADLATLRRLLARRDVSSLELTQLYLERLERFGPAYGAVVTVMHERALREAKRADAEIARKRIRGPFHGIPYGAKDVLAAAGAPTTWGAQPFRRQRFDFDATVVARLREAGAVLLAKLAMVELAGGFGYNTADASFTGPGRTPWNRAFWSGGSSSGPGAAVAAGLVGFAIGSETSGSILTPAAFCGVTGLRPTYGRVSRHGAMALSWTLDKLGPMTRSAADAELVLRALAGADLNDETAVERPFFPARKRPRIGVLKDATKNAMPAVRKNFNDALGVLAWFADVVEGVELPSLPYGPVVGAIVDAEGAAAFRELIESGRARELRAAADRTGGYAPYEILAVDYLDALRQRTLMIAEVKRAFEPFDAIATPTRGTVSYPVGRPFGDVYTEFRGTPSLIGVGNVVGAPAISVPNGFGENGLPTGLALLGRPFDELQLTAIGAEYQRRTDFHTQRPPVSAA